METKTNERIAEEAAREFTDRWYPVADNDINDDLYQQMRTRFSGMVSKLIQTALEKCEGESKERIAHLEADVEHRRVSVETLNSDKQRLQSQLTQLREENERLRELFPAILKALGNGATCANDSSIEFLSCIPKEVALVIQELTTLRAQVEDMLPVLYQAYRHVLDEQIRERNRAFGLPVESNVRLTPEEQRQLGRDLARLYTKECSTLTQLTEKGAGKGRS